jgi:hypothetical protein
MNKRAMERQAALEAEAQALTNAKADAERQLAAKAAVRARTGMSEESAIVGVMSARDKRKREKERVGGFGGSRRRLGV